MDFEISHDTSARRAALDGRLSFRDMDKFEQMAESLFLESSPRYVVDLSGIEHIDSAGLGMLLVIRQRARECEADLVLARPRDAVRTVLELAKFPDLFAMET